MIPILNPRHEWACPNCPLWEVTTESRPHIRYHSCPSLGGITAPMVPADEVRRGGTRVVVKVREDYIGDEHVTYNDEGQPIMSVETQRPDGSTDLAVMAPLAMGEVNT